jgi:hypothetical protein
MSLGTRRFNRKMNRAIVDYVLRVLRVAAPSILVPGR